jgi:hypothetical protein
LASFRVETLSDFPLTNQMFVVSAIHEGLSFRIIAVRYARYPRPEQLFVNPSIVVGLTVRVGKRFVGLSFRDAVFPRKIFKVG